jgi:hypothetical protein
MTHDFSGAAACWSCRPRLLLVLLVCVIAALLPTPASSTIASTSTSTTIASTTIAAAFSTSKPRKVLVTGAAGKTGRLVLQKLLQDPRYEPKALVRTEHSARGLINNNKNKGRQGQRDDDDVHQQHCYPLLEHIVVSDITSPTFQQDLLPTTTSSSSSSAGLDGTNAMIICTSAVPRISRRSLVAAIIQAPWNIVRNRKAIDFRSFRFKWKHGGYPEKVDYLGQIAQIQLAKKLGMDQVIIVSSMGGTDPNNFLNQVGKKKNGSGNGDILLWKRKAEMYLIEVRSNAWYAMHE